MDPYKRLQLARKNGRPSGRFYIENILTDLWNSTEIAVTVTIRLLWPALVFYAAIRSL